MSAQFAKRRRVNPAVGNYPPSITRSWLETVMIPGMTKAVALRDLNDECGTSHRQNRLYEWLTGCQNPGRDERKYMMECCIPLVLRRHGVDIMTLSDAQIDRIVRDLT